MSMTSSQVRASEFTPKSGSKNSALARLPFGKFNASAAWLGWPWPPSPSTSPAPL